MSNLSHGMQHARQHAFVDWNARRHEGLMWLTRRNMLKAGISGIAGLSLTNLLRAREEARQTGRKMGTGKSVILLWMAGGPSHIDTWDPKPTRPIDNRGPFGVIPTKLPGVQICEHLPKQAAMLDKFTIIRSVDSKFSNHEPNKVMQTANLEAEPRVNPKAEDYPAIGSIVAKHHGANFSGSPPYVAFMKSRSHIAFAGDLGKPFNPFIANQATRLPIYDLVGNNTGGFTSADLLKLPQELSGDRIMQRRSLLTQLDTLRSALDSSGAMDAVDSYGQQAVEMLVGSRAREAFDIDREPEAIRQRYGSHLWCQQALIARRLVEAGTAFITIDLSYHTASGTWDNHGDNVPPYGGITRGLGPLLPLFDHLITTLVSDLDEHGLLDDCLVIAMGEFGRTPQIGTQGSTDGRNHWQEVMSMCLAGGGLRHGQVIGATERDGGQIAQRPVTPGDLAATLYRHFQVPLDTTYLDPRGRPNFIVSQGAPIAELF